jgi:hypothetical protein
MRIHLILIALLGLILYGCPNSVNKTQKEIEKNNLNLPNIKYLNHLGIRFGLSEVFNQNFYYDFSLKKTDAVSFIAEDVSIHLSIEKYTPSELVSIQYKNKTENQSDLDALRNYYTNKRYLSLERAILSEPIELFSKTKKKGWLQSIEEIGEDDYYDLHYAIGTISHKGNYYVFQFISGKLIR